MVPTLEEELIISQNYFESIIKAKHFQFLLQYGRYIPQVITDALRTRTMRGKCRTLLRSAAAVFLRKEGAQEEVMTVPRFLMRAYNRGEIYTVKDLQLRVRHMFEGTLNVQYDAFLLLNRT